MKQKVLICAFACLKDPDGRVGFGKGGESGLGWNMVLQIARFAEVFVLTDGGNKKSIEDKMSEQKMSDVVFYYVNLPKFLNFTKKIIQIYAYLWQIKAYFVAKKLNKEINFDIFHHITYANDWMASFVGALLPIPYIRGPGGGAHRVPEKFVEEYPFKDRMVQKIRIIGQWFFKHDPFFILGQSRAQKILVCNKESFNALPQKWQKKAEFFPVNGISKEDLVISNNNNRQESEKFSIITAGKLIKIKSFDLAIKSFAKFNGKNPDSKVVIIGDGPELENLKKLSKELSVEEKIVFKKWMPRKNLLKEIALADVFLFPSLRDGGGQVVVEAMAVGKPVVCFDIAGPGFHVDENCGIKIKPDGTKQAVKDIVDALEKLYSNKDLRKRLGSAAKEKAEREYDWDVLGGRLQEIYKNVLQNEK